jgi:hypothetical protein
MTYSLEETLTPYSGQLNLTSPEDVFQIYLSNTLAPSYEDWLTSYANALPAIDSSGYPVLILGVSYKDTWIDPSPAYQYGSYSVSTRLNDANTIFESSIDVYYINPVTKIKTPVGTFNTVNGEAKITNLNTNLQYTLVVKDPTNTYMAKTLDITPSLDESQDIYVSQVPYLPANVNREYRLFRAKGIGTINMVVASISGNFAYTLTKVESDSYLMVVNNPTSSYTYSLLITQTYNGVVTSKYVSVAKG